MTDKRADNAAALLREMIRIPSTSFGEKEVCSLLSRKLSERGIDHRTIGNNIVAFNAGFDPARKTLALDAHIDTVSAAAGYTRDPLDPGDDEDIIHGLGSNDDGGSVVSMLEAFAYFYDKQMPINLALTLTCEEEKSGPDGASFIYGTEGPFGSNGPDWVIFGEPTGMQAATSERGLLVLDGTARGVSAHAARGEGVNALYIALDDIEKLRSHKFGKISPSMGEVRLNVTQISAGSAHNVIPAECKFTVDIRTTEQYSNEEILNELQGICSSGLKPRNLRNKASATFTGSPLLKAADILGIGTFSSPTTSNWMRTRSDAIKMGPGQSTRSHKADEFILKSEITEAIEKYIKFIETFYGDIVE